MQNRFTVKDFVYMLIGAVACFLLFLNMVKTDREVSSLDKVNKTLQQQQATLSSLEDAIEAGGMASVDPRTLDAILRSASARGDAGPLDVANAPETNDQPESVNIAELPNYEPGYDVRFSAASDSVNRRGYPQQWQTAPNRELPENFAPGGTLVTIWNQEPQTLTPFVSRDRYGTEIQQEVLERLVWIDLEAPYQYTPGLARSWNVSDDGMTVTFTLFDEATWPDGSAVTAEDVVFTYELVMNEQIDAPVQRSFLSDNVATCERVDERTVRFTMKQKYYDPVGVCGNLLFILPKYVYGSYGPEEYNTQIRDVLVGSGPWQLSEWTKGQSLVLTRNENYWGPKPPIETHVIRFIKNEQSGLQEFWAGKADQVTPTSQQWAEFAQSEQLRERGEAIDFYTPAGGYSYIGYNLRLAKFSDKRTRQALTMLVDRQKMIDTLRGGLGRITTGPFAPGSAQYNPDIEPWPYDPDRARALLAEVGWEDTNNDGVIDMDVDGDGTRDPFEILFRMPYSTVTEEYQRFLQEAFNRAGIQVSLDVQEWSVFEEKLNNRDFEMVMLGWTGSPESDPFQIWHSSQTENRGSNYIGFKNARADELIELGRTTVDYEKRMQYWREFHAILHEEQPYTFLFVRPRLRFVEQRLENVRVHDLRLYASEWYLPQPVQIR